jgi:hypothetical protein
MLCVSGKLSELGSFPAARHRSGKVLKNRECRYPSTLELAVKTDTSGLKNVDSPEF